MFDTRWLTPGLNIKRWALLIALGVFDYWARWATGGLPKEQNAPAAGWTRYFNVDTNHKVIGVQYLVMGFAFLAG